jgi:hypothetical protein
MFRGETFFDTAVRKVRDETGNSNAKVYPKGVVNVWNTFFPDSNWDKDRRPGYEGTQTVNVTVACELDDTDIAERQAFALDSNAQKIWAVEASQWISVSEGLKPGDFDKYVRLNLELAVKSKLIKM